MNEQAVANISAFFKKRSVEFGDVPRYNDQSSWPFWMPLIPEPPQDTVRFPPVLAQSLTGLGWPIAPGAFRDIPIALEQDAHYHLVNHKLTAFRGPVTGTITIGAGLTAVVGVGTLFLTELQVGDTIVVEDAAGETRFGIVAAIATDLALTLEAPVGPNAVAASGVTLPATFRIGNQWYENIPALTAGIRVAGVNVTGIGGTAFNTQLQIGQTICYIDDTGVQRFGTIDTIGGAAAMTFAAGTGGGAVAASTSYKTGVMPYANAANRFRPLTHYLRESMIVKSNNAVYLYGGAAELLGNAAYSPPSLGAAAGGLIERPVPTRSIQGKHDGLASLYIPFQMPKEGTLFLRVHNAHNLYTLYVNGTIFGYKVAV